MIQVTKNRQHKMVKYTRHSRTMPGPPMVIQKPVRRGTATQYFSKYKDIQQDYVAWYIKKVRNNTDHYKTKQREIAHDTIPYDIARVSTVQLNVRNKKKTNPYDGKLNHIT